MPTRPSSPHGKAITVLGWKALYQNDKGEDEEEKGELPVVRKGDAVHYRNGQVDKKATKPPPRFTPSTLLAAMKEIYKYVKDDSLKKKLKEVQGIGTEATRATIIQELIQRKFLTAEGKKKYLKPTDNAYLLVDALPDEMLYPDETAIWEERLYQMSLGKDNLEAFLRDQLDFLKSLVTAAGGVVMKAEGAKACPDCGRKSTSSVRARLPRLRRPTSCPCWRKCPSTRLWRRWWTPVTSSPLRATGSRAWPTGWRTNDCPAPRRILRRGAFFASGAYFHKGHTSNNLLLLGKALAKRGKIHDNSSI